MAEYTIAKNTLANQYRDLMAYWYPSSYEFGQKFSLTNTYLTRARFYLSKGSTDGHGTIYCRIRKASDGSVIKESPDTYDVKTEVSHKYPKWHEFTLNTIVNGEIFVTVEWAPENDSDFIRCWYCMQDVIPGHMIYRMHGWWETRATDYDATMELYASDDIVVDRDIVFSGPLIKCNSFHITNSAGCLFNGTIHCNTMTIDEGSTLRAKQGGDYDGGSIGHGAGYAASGGGHGGAGGTSRDSDGNTQEGGLVSNDDPKWPNLAGAHGGSPVNGSAVWGQGGGVLHIRVRDTLTVNGSIIAHGDVGGYDISSHATAGSGAGGSILIVAKRILGDGYIGANGADGKAREYGGKWSRSGAGGGGLVAVYYEEMSSPTLEALGGEGKTETGANSDEQDGGDGVVSSVLAKTLLGEYHISSSEKILAGEYGIIQSPLEATFNSLYYINVRSVVADSYNIYNVSTTLTCTYDIPYLHRSLFSIYDVLISKCLADEYTVWASSLLNNIYDIDFLEELSDSYDIDFLSVTLSDSYKIAVSQTIKDSYTIWLIRALHSLYDINLLESLEDSYDIDFIDRSLSDSYVIFCTKALQDSYWLWATKSFLGRYDINRLETVEDSYNISFLEKFLSDCYKISIGNCIADTYSIAPCDFVYTETDEVVFTQGILSNVVATSLGDLELAEGALSGSRVSPTYSLSAVVVAKYATISWDDTLPPRCSFTMEVDVSFDGGNTWEGWQKVSNGKPIPYIGYGTNVRNACIRMRQTLVRDSVDKNPQLHDVTVYIKTKTGMQDPPLVCIYDIAPVSKTLDANYDINVFEILQDSYDIAFLNTGLKDQYVIMVAREIKDIYKIWATKLFSAGYDINILGEISDSYDIAFLDKFLVEKYVISLGKTLADEYDVGTSLILFVIYSIEEKKVTTKEDLSTLFDFSKLFD